jgi:hypothetical protein
MPPKRSALQHFNPVKHQAIDLLSDPLSPPEDDDAELHVPVQPAPAVQGVTGPAPDDIDEPSMLDELTPSPSVNVPKRDNILKSPISE